MTFRQPNHGPTLFRFQLDDSLNPFFLHAPCTQPKVLFPFCICWKPPTICSVLTRVIRDQIEGVNGLSGPFPPIKDTGPFVITKTAARSAPLQHLMSWRSTPGRFATPPTINSWAGDYKLSPRCFFSMLVLGVSFKLLHPSVYIHLFIFPFPPPPHAASKLLMDLPFVFPHVSRDPLPDR